MKRRVISAALALCMMLTLLSGTALAAGQHPFTDVPQSHWANEAVGYVYENDLMNGVSATMFQPGGSLTRAMFVTILGRMAGAEEESGESGFADVPAGRWYSAYVAWAAGEGIVDGTGNGYFSPNSPVTREQMATMIARYVDSAGLTLPETGDPAAPFTDRNAVSDWAEAGVELMRQTGILAGYEDGTFQPQHTANRAEAATIFMRLEQVIGGEELPEESFEPITQAEGQQMVNQINRVADLDRQGTTQEEIKHYLEGVDWIRVVEETPDGGVSCRTDFGVTAVWTPQEEDVIGGTVFAETDIRSLQPVLPRSGATRSVYEAKDIVILCPEASTDENFILDGYEYLASTLAEYTGGTVTVLRDEAVSLDALKELDQYDMVWFYSHGALSNVTNSAWAISDSDPYTMTGEFATSPTAYVLLSSDFFFGRTIVNLSSGRIGVGGSFYSHYYGEEQLADMFFHFGSCNSMRTDKLAEGIRSRGAAWVEGWTESVYFNNDYAHLMVVVSQLLQGVSVQNSIDAAEQYVEETYQSFGQPDCDLVGRGDESYTLKPLEQDLSQLVGVYEGSYFASQGETGLTLTVYEENGGYRALFDFYNLPGRTNAKEGSYTMDVTVTDQGAFRFDADQWVEKPSGYRLLDLEGTLQGEVLSGDSPTPFSITKCSDTTTLGEKSPAQIAKAIQETSDFTWNWFYDNQYTDKNDLIQAPYKGGTWTYERVNYAGITKKQDVLEMAKGYYEEGVAETVVAYKEWVEQDGKLYVSATEGLGGIWPERVSIAVEKENDLCYRIICCEYLSGELYQPPYEIQYRYQHGNWVFDQPLIHVGVEIEIAG